MLLKNSRVQVQHLSSFYRSLSASSAKLPNLKLKEKIETIEHNGSFMREFFFRRVDHRILAYPRILVEEEEYNTARTIPDILRQNVESLAEIGDRSATEIAIIYEATGRLGVPYILNRIQHTMSHYMLNQVKRNVSETAKIGYGFTEREKKMGALPISEWDSMATFNAEDKSWHVKGTKTMLLDEPYEQYIVFCKNEQVKVEGWPADRPPPVAYGAFLLDKSHVNVTHFKLGEISFQQITFDVSLPEDAVLFKPAIEKGELFKSKALGHLAVAAWTVGRLKEYYRFIKPRKDLNWIYTFHLNAVDSLVYYVAGLMDSFTQTDFELEGLALKVNAIDMAQRCTQFLQICNPDCKNSNYGLIGALNDSFALADLFYESTDRAKLLLGLEGISYVASYEHDYLHKVILAPLYPEIVLTRIKRWFNRKYRNKHDRITGYFDMNLSPGSLIIEQMVFNLGQIVEMKLLEHSKKILLEQMDVKRIGHISALIVKGLATHARVDHTVQHRLAHLDHFNHLDSQCLWADRNFSENLFWRLVRGSMESSDAAIDKIHSRSVKYGGYWAFSPLDKIHK